LFLTVPIALAACAKTDPESSRPTAIRVVTWKPTQPEVWDTIFNNFEHENPGFKVVREVGPHSSTVFHDLLTQKLKNRSEDVDVFLMDVTWPPEFAAAGWAAPLDEVFPASEREKFLEGAILANTYEDQIYGVPLFVDSGVLYYRKDLLEKYGFRPPATWNDLVSQARQIVEKERQRGQTIFGFSGQFKQYEGLVCDMMEYVLSRGGRILNPETGKSSIAEEPAVEAVRFVRDQIINGVAPAGVLTYEEPESLDLFVQGKAVFHRNWPYAWEVSNNPKRSKVSGKIGIASLPHFEGGKSYATLGGWQVGISRFSKNQEPAWKLVEYLTGERIQRFLAVEAGLAPTRKTVYADSKVLEVNPQFAEMREVFLTAYPRPRTPLYAAVSNVLQRYFSKAISNSDSDIETEAMRAAREIDALLAVAR
jgi:multiple sugar transport system substrate-binding protein